MMFFSFDFFLENPRQKKLETNQQNTRKVPKNPVETPKNTLEHTEQNFAFQTGASLQGNDADSSQRVFFEVFAWVYAVAIVLSEMKPQCPN